MLRTLTALKLLIAMIRVTVRRLRLYRFLHAAHWASTSQAHRLLFPPDSTLDATSKWLRKGVDYHHLVAFRPNRMSETLFALGPEGKRVLEQAGAGTIRLERRPPKQLEHFSAINDVRIAAEQTGALSFFFSCWELPALGWRAAIIPDAVFELAGRTFALEADRGVEGIRYFLRTKITAYERGLEGLSLAGLIIVTDRKARLESLARAVAVSRLQILFTTLEQVQKHDLSAPIFCRHGDRDGLRLV